MTAAVARATVVIDTAIFEWGAAEASAETIDLAEFVARALADAGLLIAAGVERP